jgi:hypothetical protein
METYQIIIFKFLTHTSKTKWQFWGIGEEKVIDYDKFRDKSLNEIDYTNTYKIAKTILRVAEVNKTVISKMSKNFIELSIVESEPRLIDDITQFKDEFFPLFRNNCEL